MYKALVCSWAGFLPKQITATWKTARKFTDRVSV